jgi:TolB protein
VTRSRGRIAAVLLGLVSSLLLVPAPAQAAGGLPALVFSSDRDGDEEIFLRLRDGSLRRLTSNRALESGPVWSPSGRHIAFVSDRDGDEDVYVMRADGTVVRRLTRDAGAPASDLAPAWSPDGTRIAFVSTRSGGPEIWVMDADGGRPRQLTDNEPFTFDTTPSWSPDGRRLAFVSSRAGNETVDVYVMRADGTGVRAVTPTGDTNDGTLPEWSPDGRLIAYSTNITRGQQDIWVVDPVTGHRRFLGGHPRYDDVQARWTADGRDVVFWTFEYFTPEEVRSADLWTMRADGSGRRLLLGSPAEESAPDPRPRRPVG